MCTNYHVHYTFCSASDKLRESFVLDYGTTLIGHSSLWEVGLSYLDFCPNSGIHAIELLLARIPFNTEIKANKLIREAKNRELSHVGKLFTQL